MTSAVRLFGRRKESKSQKLPPSRRCVLFVAFAIVPRSVDRSTEVCHFSSSSSSMTGTFFRRCLNNNTPKEVLLLSRRLLPPLPRPPLVSLLSSSPRTPVRRFAAGTSWGQQRGYDLTAESLRFGYRPKVIIDVSSRGCGVVVLPMWFGAVVVWCVVLLVVNQVWVAPPPPSPLILLSSSYSLSRMCFHTYTNICIYIYMDTITGIFLHGNSGLEYHSKESSSQYG